MGLSYGMGELGKDELNGVDRSGTTKIGPLPSGKEVISPGTVHS